MGIRLQTIKLIKRLEVGEGIPYQPVGLEVFATCNMLILLRFVFLGKDEKLNDISDEYTVPVCRLHHRDLHTYGDEASWWAAVSIDPLPMA